MLALIEMSVLRSEYGEVKAMREALSFYTQNNENRSYGSEFHSEPFTESTMVKR